VRASHRRQTVFTARRCAANRHPGGSGREAVARGFGREEPTEACKAQLLETRRAVVRGWSGIADDLVVQGQVELALAVRDFVKGLPPVKTEREWILARMLQQVKARDDRREQVSDMRAGPDRDTGDAPQRLERFRGIGDYTR
jgi:hypothetical protein